MPTTRKEFAEFIAQLEKVNPPPFTDTITQLETLPRGNFWQTGFWAPGFWDECRVFREVIGEFEK